MIECKNCGQPINESAMFCKYCGAPVVREDAPEIDSEETKAGLESLSLELRQVCDRMISAYVDAATLMNRKKEEMSAVEAQFEQANQEIAKLKNSLSDAYEEIAALRMERSNLESDITTQKQEISRLNQELSSLRNDPADIPVSEPTVVVAPVEPVPPERGFCPNCGKPVKAEAAFCGNCGTKLR